jgi:hypothetical protein
VKGVRNASIVNGFISSMVHIVQSLILIVQKRVMNLKESNQNFSWERLNKLYLLIHLKKSCLLLQLKIHYAFYRHCLELLESYFFAGKGRAFLIERGYLLYTSRINVVLVCANHLLANNEGVSIVDQRIFIAKQ